jgi:hypothetical protein
MLIAHKYNADFSYFCPINTAIFLAWKMNQNKFLKSAAKQHFLKICSGLGAKHFKRL